MLIVFALCGLNSLVDLKNEAKSSFITKFKKKLDIYFSILIQFNFYTYLCRLCCLSAPADLFGILAEIGFLIRFKQTSINRKKPFCKSPKTSENVQTQVFDELFNPFKFFLRCCLIFLISMQVI